MKRRALVLLAAVVLLAGLWIAIREHVVPGPPPARAPGPLTWSTEDLPPFCAAGPTVVDDVSRLNPAEVGVICVPVGDDAIAQALDFARGAGQHVSIAGAKHSQGGHTSIPGGVHLDMTQHRGVTIEGGVATVRTGSTWADVQQAANAVGLAVQVQQSSNVFTVGGSLSVNCHGRDTDFGPIATTVRRLRLMTADGRVHTLDPAHPWFGAVIGGYGLLGVILDADLALRPNAVVHKSVVEHGHDQYIDRLAATVADPTVQLHFGRLAIDELDGPGYLRSMYSVEHRATGEVSTGAPLVVESGASLLGRAMELGEWSKAAKSLRWRLLLDRVDVPGSTETMTLNDAMRPPVAFLFERSGTTTVNILQEYFVPLDGFVPFVEGLRSVALAHRVDLQNVTTRYVASGGVGLLSYAPAPRIAVVLYINQPLTAGAIARGGVWTRELVDLSLGLGGSYYLAYQRWPSIEQLRRAYPAWDAFAEVKAAADPAGRFTNQWWQHYGPL